MECKYLKEVTMIMKKNQDPYDSFKAITSKDSYKAMKLIIGEQIDVTETVIAVFMNTKNESIGWFRVSSGGVSSCIVDMKVVLSAALNCLASTIIICHNHPSGGLKPSSSDDILTKRLNDACKLLDIALLDHLIITENSYYSYADEGKL